ncbi:MAG: hypothetical protein R3F49_19965 [Planctomycetota bacterium]
MIQHRALRTLAAGLVALGGFGAVEGASAALPQEVAPRAELDGAFDEARAASQRLLLGVFTAGEARSEDCVKRLWSDKEVRAALADCVPVQALTGAVSKADARRFGGHDPDVHRILERAVRDHVPVNAEGVLATPQHIWFAADGRVLIAAPFELQPEEFLWLDWRSRQLAGDAEARPADSARPPRRYLEGQAYAPADGDLFGRGLLPAELEADLDTLRRRGQGGGGRGGRGGFGGGANWSREAIDAFVRLAFTDEKDAQKEIESELGSIFLRMGGGTSPLLDAGLEIVAFAAPARGAETVIGFLSDTVPSVRARAAAALEAMGFEGEGWKELRKALDKEDDAVVRGALLRAAGVVGRKDAAARRLLEKEARERPQKGRTNVERIAALIGLGHVGDGAGSEAAFRAALGDTDANVALAAVAGMALTRDRARFAPALKERAGSDPANAALYDAALAVLDGAPLVRLRGLIERVAPDDFPRPRLYFEARPPGNVTGAGMGEGRGGRGGGNGGTGGGGTGGGGTGGGGTGGGGGR